jgi:hypothetical protein
VCSPCITIQERDTQHLLVGLGPPRVRTPTVCFMCFRCMLHMFHLDVAKVDLVLHMLQWLYTYVASVCFKCFSYFKRMLQLFYLDIGYVAVAIHVCCKCMFECFTCFRPMLQVFHLDVAYVQTYVASIYSKCFICFRRMLQMCLYVCCSCYTYICKCMFVNVSLVLDVCCRSSYMLQH